MKGSDYMQKRKDIKVGIGFATGRKSFQKVLGTNIYNWKESGLLENERIRLNLFVAYDLNYQKTKVTDFTEVQPERAEQVDSRNFIGSIDINKEIKYLTQEKVINQNEARMIFGRGYAANY